jgi:hypothetical protein
METLLVAKRDLVIARVLDRLADGRITTELAARELGKSSRQVRRLRRRYEQAGLEGPAIAPHRANGGQSPGYRTT